MWCIKRLREVYDETSIMEYELCALQMKLYMLHLTELHLK